MIAEWTDGQQDGLRSVPENISLCYQAKRVYMRM